MSELEHLRKRFPSSGQIEWIGRAAARRAAVEAVDAVAAVAGTGLDGDHHAKNGGKRQVTLIQKEHLPVIAGLCGRESAPPELLRRNLVVSGINLFALRKRRFRVGEVVLEGIGPCPPCSRMEENLGSGGYQATRGHGGIAAIVVEGGTICVGDAVSAVDD